MHLDPSWKPPAGMEPVLHYPDGHTGVPVVGYAYLNTNGTKHRNNHWYEFCVGANHEKAPVLPLRGYGEAVHVGWDIPTKWAVDAAGNCYLGSTRADSVFGLLYHIDDDEEACAAIRALLGMKPALPKWMVTALTQGWVPPADFSRDTYET